MDSTIVICSKDRKAELRECLVNCQSQLGEPPILVVDDGSSDGTYAMVKNEFPRVNVVRLEKNIGLINARNLAATLVKTTFLCSIDDDARFSQEDIVLETERRFDHPQIAAVAIPVVQIHEGNRLHQSTEPGNTLWTRQFIGTAYAIRVQTFLDMGGFPTYLYRQEEELHLGLALHKAGFRIRVGWGAPIHHHESVIRNRSAIQYYQARNMLLFIFRHTPWVLVPAHLLGNLGNHIRMYGWRLGASLRGYAAGLVDYWKYHVPREPVTLSVFWSFRRLGKALKR